MIRLVQWEKFLMKRVLILSVFITAYSLFANAQSAISGQVSDSEGAAIRNGRVLTHWDPAGSSTGLSDNIGIKQDVTAITDSNGKYSVSVPAGFYDVFVSGTAFTPTAAKVRVKPGKIARSNAKLKADKLVGEELGPKFDVGPSKK